MLSAERLSRIIATPLTLGVYLGPEFPDGSYTPYGWLRYVEQEIITALYSPGNEIIIVSVPFQVGKDLALDTPLLTENKGWTTVGEIEVGDLVFAPDGSTTKVIQTHPIAWSPNGCYRVTTTDGRSVVAGGEHLWRVQPRDAKERVMTTRELAEARLFGEYPRITAGKEYTTKLYRFGLPATPRIEMADVELPLDPYTLGVWLGDGSTDGGAVSFNGDDYAEISSMMVGELISARDHRPKANCVTGTWRLGPDQPLCSRLREIGVLGDKHIPEIYLSAGTSQRLALLRGLMDTDGTSSGGGVELTLTNERLAEQAHWLALSLGYRANIAEGEAKLNGRYISQRWRITFTVQPDDPMPFALKRKADGVRIGRRKQTCSIASVDKVEDTWTRCITVDRADGMFLAGRELVPTHNSTYFSLLLPTWYLGRFPNRTWLNISYNDERAKSWGRLTRNTLRRHGQELFGVQVDTESDSAGEWHFANYTGGMISSGIRSTVNGVTAHVIVIDDHLKSMEEANSPQVKSRNMDEFDSVIMGRFQSNPTAPTKCLIINTRMVEDDIGGTLLERASQPGYEGFPVRLINIKAIAEPDPHDLAEMSDDELAEWRDALGRRHGETLESRHTSEFYHLRRKSLPPSMWSAMYQGLPTFSAGGMFPEEHWRFWATQPVDDPLVVQLPELTKRVRVWDVASSEGSGDWTVGSLWGRDRIGRTFLLDRARFRHGPGRTHDLIVDTAHADGFEVPVLIEQERSGAGATVVEGFQRALPGFVVEGAKAEASKESRATPYSTAQNKAMVHLPFGAPWIREWTTEHAQMDGKGKRPKHDDQIDTGAYAHRYLLSAGESAILDIQGIDQIEGLSDTERAEAKMLLDALGMMG